jgi:hypothetical protein
VSWLTAGGAERGAGAGDDRRVDHALALVHARDASASTPHAGHAFLEQVADTPWVMLDQPHRVMRLKVVGQDEHPDVRVRRADFLGGDEAFVGVGRRHLDVDDRDVGACQRDFAAQFPGGPGLADDVEAGLGQQPVKPVPEEYLVVCDHDSHGISARIIARPSGPRTVMTLPPSAPTRSSRSVMLPGALSVST